MLTRIAEAMVYVMGGSQLTRNCAILGFDAPEEDHSFEACMSFDLVDRRLHR